ncbi:MAG: FeoB-associated Cys-rich membrane protein [Candidatus Methanoplasma sp.]|jgi:multisubunit Na+/H+ antiporter MnhC subunit|nr:FeoB-associated Cys-rich membrane protein [Candidatus Methanoplasma sp.]
MSNLATIAVGLAIVAILVAAAYSVYRDHKSGGCPGCNECCKNDSNNNSKK